MGKKFLTPKVKKLLVAALCLTVLVTLIAALAQGVTVGKNAVGSALSPLRSAVAGIDRAAERIYDYLFRFDELQAENELLRQKVTENELAAQTLAQYRREIRRLEDLLELKHQHTDYSFLAANVISWGTSAWERTLTVDRGTKDGLKEGLCAVTELGEVVGIITECGLNWSTVATVFDEGTAIAATLAGESGSGVVSGVRLPGGAVRLQMDYLPVDAAAEPGGAVLTAGSAYYPAGLRLGTIASSKPDEGGVWRSAVLESAVSIEKLEEVFFLTDYRTES